MSTGVRWAVVVGVLLAALFAAWRVAGVIRSDAALDAGDAPTALRVRPHNPEALLRQAAGLRAQGDLDGAEQAARSLLRTSPADGRGYRVLAQVAEARGDKALASRLFAVAARRAPRDLEARAWLAQEALDKRDASAALEHIDRVLVYAPGAGARLYPLLGALSADPGFADELSRRLAARPAWRSGLLGALQANRAKDPGAIDRVLSGLQRHGGLDAAEFDAWIESMMQQGRWGEAHARWASRQMEAGARIPLLFNGDFAADPSGSGFDWRLRRTAGLLAAVERADGRRALRLQFMGRRVAPGALAEHALLLPPGSYVLEWRERTEALRAGAGLGWQVACAEQGTVLEQAPPTDGTRPWRERSLAFTVPTTGCQGQWLRLGSPGGASAGQMLAGEAWYAGLRIVKADVGK